MIEGLTVDMVVVREVVLPLAAATVIGSALGAERELRGKPAGMRTHALVALGAALVTIVSIHATDSADAQSLSRVIQGVIAGVGFLGGGAILKSAGEEYITGLTTAASIWLVASLGVACGAGMWLAALVAVGFALVVLILGTPFESLLRRLMGKPPANGQRRVDHD